MEMRDPMKDFAIDYAWMISRARPDQYEELVEYLIDELPYRWSEQYRLMIDHEPYILDVPDRGFNFLFDLTLAKYDKNDPERPDDRVVAAYGRSRPAEAKRDASRIRGFGKLEGGRGPRDKGHFMAHSMGGSLDINIFPQHPDVNRGRGEYRLYRKMERYAAAHPGTFVFSRPIYLDSGWVPHALEYGILLPEPRFWIERFPN
jgi:hypothetical protein